MITTKPTVRSLILVQTNNFKPSHGTTWLLNIDFDWNPFSLFYSLQQHTSNDQASFISETESSVTNEQSKAHTISASHERDHGAASKTTEENTKNEEQGCNVRNPEESHPPSGLKENKTGVPHSFNIKSTLEKKDLVNHIKGVIYGNCIGDAIGLLTEFMSKSEAAHVSKCCRLIYNIIRLRKFMINIVIGWEYANNLLVSNIIC